MSRQKVKDIKLNAAFAALGLTHAHASRGKIYLRKSEIPLVYNAALATGAQEYAETIVLMYGRSALGRV